MAEIWGAAIVGAAVVGGAAISASASGKAAGAQENAANTAADTQRYMYDTTSGYEAPYRQAGQTALSQLSAGTAPGGQFMQSYTGADLTSDPGYQFRLAQGEKGVENSASAAGMALSGAALKGLDQYNQNFASNEYQNAYNRFNTDQSNRYNRLYNIAGLGQNANSVTATSGAAAANGIASAQIGAGNAAAAGYVGQANAINGGISTLGNYYQAQNALSGSSYGSGGNYWYNGGNSTAGLIQDSELPG
jgi:hypothetical protein